jgi:hypothetical protein
VVATLRSQPFHDLPQATNGFTLLKEQRYAVAASKSLALIDMAGTATSNPP